MDEGWAEKIGKNSPELADFARLLVELKKESPRGIVLIMAGYLEQDLKELLRAYILDVPSSSALLDGSLAPLGSFGSLIHSCYSFGLVDADEFHDLNLIRKIRNEFAHRVGVSFDTDRVRDLCNNFKLDVQPYYDEESFPEPVPTQTRFTAPAMSLILSMWHRRKEVQEIRLKPLKWKQ